MACAIKGITVLTLVLLGCSIADADITKLRAAKTITSRSTAQVVNPKDAARRACKVFCNGPLLDMVQRAGIFEDSKTFTDLPLLQDPEVVLEAFARLEQREEPAVLRAFLAEYFGKEPGEELQAWTPPDWTEKPQVLESIANAEHRQWALELNNLWKTLGRIQNSAVTEAPQRHSALPRRFGMVVPGGRFRETYYWDTYWIVRGLLLCNLVETARGVVDNLLDDVRVFGFVPNGGRIYYLDRSQPPFLTEMVQAVHEALLARGVTNGTWLGDALTVLDEEYRFWMDPAGGHRVSVSVGTGSDKELLTLNNYFSTEATPRPESYAEDLATAAQAEKSLGRSRDEVWKGLRSAAESGWDFSSRWLAAAAGGAANLTTVNASAVVPVDLNSILYRTELTLSRLHAKMAMMAPREEVAAHSAAATRYTAAADQRAHSMNSLLWDNAAETYRDYRLDVGEHSRIVSVSDYGVPLWAGLAGPGGARGDSILSSLKSSGLLQAGGASTTTLFTGQQWDAPNAWAPLELMLVEGLDSLHGNVDAQELARTLATEWLDSGLTAWKQSHVMYEKYNAFEPGSTGGGGEYKPQMGFGWTNGVALVLLLREDGLRPSNARARYLDGQSIYPHINV